MAPRVTRKRRGVVLLVVLVFLINLPIVHSTITNWRVSSSGVDVTAEVTDARVTNPDDDPRYWLGIRFSEDIDPDQTIWPVEVDPATYDAALEARQIEARVLKSNPAAFRVEGEVRGWLGLITTLIADAILLLILLVVRRLGAARDRRRYGWRRSVTSSAVRPAGSWSRSRAASTSSVARSSRSRRARSCSPRGSRRWSSCWTATRTRWATSSRLRCAAASWSEPPREPDAGAGRARP